MTGIVILKAGIEIPGTRIAIPETGIPILIIRRVIQELIDRGVGDLAATLLKSQ
jgi:hypothetical protein